MEKVKDRITFSQDNVTVPANDFSEKKNVKAEHSQIISIGFKPTDGKEHEVYPVYMAPKDNSLRVWDVIFYNNEAADVELDLYGIEPN